ncbi:MAG TPA: GntR family transcriptional regulator, partial [Methylomirabilota bacterium]|nr:GntR family transcriptional regulator [Methylomirabilota bacterium]
MKTASSEVVLRSLFELVDTLEDGARLPTVRDLMKRFRVSQSAVQSAFDRLRRDGLVTSQVGRGSYVTKSRHPDSGDRAVNGSVRVGGAVNPGSLLILSNSSMNERCMLVQNHMTNDMVATGGTVVQMSYHDTDHLLNLLRTAPNFDGIILQSHYELIPVRLLHLLQQKTRALVVDGHSLSGVDIDRVGTDWEEALALGLDHLTALGHRRIGLVSLDTPAQPVMSVRRAFARIDNWRGAPVEAVGPILLNGVQHPTQSVDTALAEALADCRSGERTLPFTALIYIGISDGEGIRQSLDRLSIRCPEDLSVYGLGHPTVSTEHFGRFTMAGSGHEEAASGLMDAIRMRLRTPSADASTRFLPCREVVRASTAAPSTGVESRNSEIVAHELTE